MEMLVDKDLYILTYCNIQSCCACRHIFYLEMLVPLVDKNLHNIHAHFYLQMLVDKDLPKS